MRLAMQTQYDRLPLTLTLSPSKGERAPRRPQLGRNRLVDKSADFVVPQDFWRNPRRGLWAKSADFAVHRWKISGLMLARSPSNCRRMRIVGNPLHL